MRGRGIGQNSHKNCKKARHLWVARTPQKRELELELIQNQMTQKPMLRAEVGMRVRCANKASAECIMRGRGIGQNPRKNCKKARHLWVARTPQKQ